MLGYLRARCVYSVPPTFKTRYLRLKGGDLDLPTGEKRCIALALSKREGPESFFLSRYSSVKTPSLSVEVSNE